MVLMLFAWPVGGLIAGAFLLPSALGALIVPYPVPGQRL